MNASLVHCHLRDPDLGGTDAASDNMLARLPAMLCAIRAPGGASTYMAHLHLNTPLPMTTALLLLLSRSRSS